MFRKILFSVALFAASSMSAQAALQSRLSGQAYYDTVLNITWLANANLAASNTFGVTGINVSGKMSWAKSGEWIAAMNTANYLGINNWRAPTVTDTGTSGCNFAYTGTDCGWNMDLSTGEMARMFYSTLGNTGYYNTSGSPTGCAGGPSYCLTSVGPFSNLKSDVYWTGTPYAPSPSTSAWYFDFQIGYQDYSTALSSERYVWAVRAGDIVETPVPAAAWLFGGAVAGLGVLKRRQAKA